MIQEDFFLAFRQPGDRTRFYGPSQNSKLYFHFSDLDQQHQLKLSVEELSKAEFSNWHYKEAQVAPSKEMQMSLYEHAIHDMQVGILEKVVLSRIENIFYHNEVFDLFSALESQHPRAAVYLFSHPKTGTWVGATPETLLSWSSQELQIDSLAGTKKWENRDSFGDKEYQEQEMVSEEVKSILNSMPTIKEVSQSSRTILKAGPLAHLHTSFTATLNKDFNWRSLVDKLHPTPAVGGRPQKKAMDFISKHELYNRRFYTGYFGLEENEAGQFWVNLRCAELCQDHILSLYVGGGLTAQSDAEAEWQETEAKAATILNVLKS